MLNLMQDFEWTLDVEAGYALRGRLRRPTSPGTSVGSPLFTPVTAMCYMQTGKYYPSLQYEYAASEINLDPSVAHAIEMLSDCYVKDSPYYASAGSALKDIRYRILVSK